MGLPVSSSLERALSLACLSHEEPSASLWEGHLLDETDGWRGCVVSLRVGGTLSCFIVGVISLRYWALLKHLEKDLKTGENEGLSQSWCTQKFFVILLRRRRGVKEEKVWMMRKEMRKTRKNIPICCQCCLPVFYILQQSWANSSDRSWKWWLQSWESLPTKKNWCSFVIRVANMSPECCHWEEQISVKPLCE